MAIWLDEMQKQHRQIGLIDQCFRMGIFQKYIYSGKKKFPTFLVLWDKGVGGGPDVPLQKQTWKKPPCDGQSWSWESLTQPWRGGVGLCEPVSLFAMGVREMSSAPTIPTCSQCHPASPQTWHGEAHCLLYGGEIHQCLIM